MGLAYQYFADLAQFSLHRAANLSHWFRRQFTRRRMEGRGTLPVFWKCTAFPARRHIMSDKSPRKGEAKKPAKSIKEKRAEKRLKSADSLTESARKNAK